MKRFSGVEVGMLIVASLFIVCGAVTAIRPGGGNLLVSGGKAPKWPVTKATAVRISKGTERGLGVIAILFGAGFVWLVFQKPEEK
jgi:hypothetical protein